MTAADMIEKAAELTEKAFDQIKADTVRDILDTLEDFLKEFVGERRDGFEAAIEVIQSNYSY